MGGGGGGPGGGGRGEALCCLAACSLLKLQSAAVKVGGKHEAISISKTAPGLPACRAAAMLVCPHWRAAMHDAFEAALEWQPAVVFCGFEPEFYKKLSKYYDRYDYATHEQCTVTAAKDAAWTDQTRKEQLLNLAALLSPRTYSVRLEGFDDQVGGPCMPMQRPVRISVARGDVGWGEEVLRLGAYRQVVRRCHCVSSGCPACTLPLHTAPKLAARSGAGVDGGAAPRLRHA